MKNETKIIYLNCFDEAETDESYLPIDNNFESLDSEFVLWSADTPVLGGNIKYINQSEVDRMIKEAVKVSLQVASENAETTTKVMPTGPDDFDFARTSVNKRSILDLEEEILKQLNIKR